MKRFPLILAFALTATSAFAQSADQTARLRAACEADAHQLCGNVMPGGGRILACLQAQGDQVSPGCRAAMAEGQQLKQQSDKAGKSAN